MQLIFIDWFIEQSIYLGSYFYLGIFVEPLYPQQVIWEAQVWSTYIYIYL